LVDVRFTAHFGLKPDIAESPLVAQAEVALANQICWLKAR